MSGTYKFKEIYSEGVLKGSQSQIKKSSGASALTPDAAAQLGPKAVELQRKKAKQVDVPGFVKTVRNEEVELGEAKVESGKSQEEKEIIRNKRAGIDKDPMAFPGRKMQNIYRMELHMDTRGEKKERGKKVNEKIDVGADAGATISDFVHSKSATFKGDSKKQRIKRALGAYYAAQKEETENIYNYVIETLVGSEFAEDYETAENMFEHMSSEFVAVILEEYIEEAKRSRTERRAANAGKKGYNKEGNPIPRVSTTHVIDDIDDNRADQRHPDAAKIDVMRNNTKTKSLTPGQFAHHKLEPGDKYGFNAFRDTKLFKDTTKPIKSVGRLGDSPRRPAKRSVVTARGGSAFGSNKPSTPMDDPGSFAKDLRDRIGIRGLKRKDVHFTGGMSKGPNKGLSGPEKKGKLVSKIVDPSDKKLITTDDHLGNTRAMAAAASAATPQAKVIAYQSRPSTRKPKGKGKVGDIVPKRVGKENKPGDTNIGIRANTNPSKSTKETQRRRQRARRGMGEEMSSYEYWKQFVGESAYTGGPVGRSEMITSNNERAKQSSTSSSPTSTTTRPGTTPTSTTTRPGTTQKPQSSTGGLLGSLDRLARDTAGKVGEKIGRNKTGNIPIISDIGGAVGKQKGTDMYDNVTAPFRKEEVSSYEYWKQFINEDSELISELSVTAQRELDALKRIPSNLARNAALKLKPNMLMGREIGNLARIPFTALPRLARAGLGRAALGVDTVLNTTAQEKGAEDFQKRSGGVRPGELYKASDVDSKGAPKAGAEPQLASIEAAVRGNQATKDSKSTLKKPTNIISRKIIDAKNIAGNQQKVTTNKAYDAKLGGYKASATYGDTGRRMIRANIGNAGVNQVKAGKAKVGQSYASQLGGLKGTVKYDAQGNRSFQALQKSAPTAPRTTPVPGGTSNDPNGKKLLKSALPGGGGGPGVYDPKKPLKPQSQPKTPSAPTAPRTTPTAKPTK